MAECPYKIGDRVRLVRRGVVEGDCGLRDYIDRRLEVTLTQDIRRYVDGIWRMYGRPDAYGEIYFFSDMVEPVIAYRKGQVVLRVIHNNGRAEEKSVDRSDYDKMSIGDIANCVIGSHSLVSGTKSKIEGMDFTILTRGTAEEDNGAVY